MRKSYFFPLLVVIEALGFFGTLAPFAYSSEKSDILSQARQSYYSLSALGVTGFRCQIEPDWDSTFIKLKPDQLGQDSLPILKKTRFQVLVGPNGASNVSHESDVAPPNEQVAERIRQAVGGMEQVVTGFLQTWSQFVMAAPPFPSSDSEYQLQDIDGKYRLTYKEQKSDVVMTINHDLTIAELRVPTPDFSGSVRPKFDKTKNVFILSSYEATYKAGSSTSGELSVKIEYGEMEGLNLPSKVVATTTMPNRAVDLAFTFSDCRITKH